MAGRRTLIHRRAPPLTPRSSPDRHRPRDARRPPSHNPRPAVNDEPRHQQRRHSRCSRCSARSQRRRGRSGRGPRSPACCSAPAGPHRDRRRARGRAGQAPRPPRRSQARVAARRARIPPRRRGFLRGPGACWSRSCSPALMLASPRVAVRALGRPARVRARRGALGAPRRPPRPATAGPRSMTRARDARGQHGRLALGYQAGDCCAPRRATRWSSSAPPSPTSQPDSRSRRCWSGTGRRSRPRPRPIFWRRPSATGAGLATCSCSTRSASPPPAPTAGRRCTPPVTGTARCLRRCG